MRLKVKTKNMYTPGAATLLLITAGIVAIIKLVKEFKKENNKQDPYKGFHLGEMTHHDVPPRFTKRTTNPKKWTSNLNDIPDKDRGGTKNEKVKQQKK